MRCILLACALISVFALGACGDGAFKRALTVSGIYTVKRPDGYPVVCFIEAKGGGIDCVPIVEMVEPEKTAKK